MSAMKSSLIPLLILAGSCWAQSNGAGQPSQSAESQGGTVVLTKLVPPMYPPLARQARISGDVKLRLIILPDGSVKSAEVLEGHPMLKQAALDSARRSQYECQQCGESGTLFLLTYTFGFFDDTRCGGVVTEQRVRAPQCGYLWKCGKRQITTWPEPSHPASEVTQAPGHVTIIVSVVCLETQYSRAGTR